MSNVIATSKTALKSLRINPGRSILTVLGIVIGIIAIVLVIALGQGAEQLILGEIEGIGGNIVIVRPGRQPEGPTDFADTILADSVTAQDVDALRRTSNVPGIISVDPALIVSGEATHQDNIYRPLTLGWTARGMSDSFGVVPNEGSNFTEDDIRQHAKVAILGHKVKTELFGESDAVGRTIKIRGFNLRVIGVYPPRGQVSSFNVDELVLIPYTTAQKDILSINHFHEVFIRTKPEADVEIVAEDVRATLRERHGITDPQKDDFFVLTQADIVETLSTITNALTVFLVAIASISLVVGGVGIMNIMLVSVTERTQEIGLRKAVGATNTDILKQFLIESIILTVGGGLIGTTLALVLATVITFIARSQFNLAWPLQLPVGAILLGVSVATTIGLVFGIYPARKAAMKNPIEALRYE